MYLPKITDIHELITYKYNTLINTLKHPMSVHLYSRTHNLFSSNSRTEANSSEKSVKPVKVYKISAFYIRLFKILVHWFFN